MRGNRKYRVGKDLEGGDSSLISMTPQKCL